MIKQLSTLPTGILDLSADQLHTIINNHTLIHLTGEKTRPIFISVLQHGDEYTGWDALREYLIKYQHNLKRSVSILFGNIQAAKQNVRQIDGEADFNRRWPSHLNLDGPVATTMREITKIMREINPFASIDIHNNSGRNPHYSGINSLNPEFINLASLFSQSMIYFTSPAGIQSSAFAKFCPSITIECGLSGTSGGQDQTYTFLEKLFNIETLHTASETFSGHNIFKIQASIRIKAGVNFGFNKDNDFILEKNLDVLNFQHLTIGEKFGEIRGELAQNQSMPLSIFDKNNCEISNEYFSIINNNIVCVKSFVPAMITQSIKAIKNDCLCYIMKPITIQEGK